jgi:hypothetical protein
MYLKRKNTLKIKEIIKIFIPHSIIIIYKKYFAKYIFNYLRGNPKYLSARENSILLIEFLPYHGETLPGFVKYFLDLDYNVDLVLCNSRDGRNDTGLFSCFNLNDKLRVKFLSDLNINLLLRSSETAKYKHIFFNSYYDKMEDNYYKNINLFKLKPICVAHNPDIKNIYFKTNKVITLVKMKLINGKSPFVVNPHYYGEFNKRNKSKKTTFFTLNSSNLSRRNLYLLFEACDRLYKELITDFTVKIVGNGIPIPECFRDNITDFGFLDFQSMYKEISESDFILALIDQTCVHYTNKASGTYQLSYGFLKPIVLHKKFSDKSGFNETNSILYNDDDDLSHIMKKCINMPNDDYLSIVNALEISEKELYFNSLNNLRTVLEISI